MRKSNVTKQIRVTEETYNYINNSTSDVYKIGDKLDSLLGLMTSMTDTKPKKKYADKPHMNIKGIIEAQILNCFSPKVSFDAKPKVVKEEFGKKMEEEIKELSGADAIEEPADEIIVSRFEIIYAVHKMWNKGCYIDPDRYLPLSPTPKQIKWSDIYPDWTNKNNKRVFEDDVDNLLKSLSRRGLIYKLSRGLYGMDKNTLIEKEWEIISSLLIQPPRQDLSTDLPIKAKRK